MAEGVLEDGLCLCRGEVCLCIAGVEGLGGGGGFGGEEAGGEERL